MAQRNDSGPNRGFWLWASSAAVLLSPRVARAEPAESACSDRRVILEGALDARWIEPLARLCTDLAAMPDVDPSARLHVVAAGQDVIVEVTLADGRSALRRVQSPDDLRVTVEALTVVPPAPRPAPAEPDKAATPVVAAPRPQAPPNERGTIEIATLATSRYERVPTYFGFGVEAEAAVRLERWLLGLTMRWDVAEFIRRDAPKGFEMTSAGVGFRFARRIPIARAFDLDAGGCALLFAQSQSSVQKGVEITDAETDIRLGAGVRALLGASALRFAFTLEGDLSPTRLGNDMRVAAGFPTLPAWSVGFGLGTVWGAT